MDLLLYLKNWARGPETMLYEAFYYYMESSEDDELSAKSKSYA